MQKQAYYVSENIMKPHQQHDISQILLSQSLLYSLIACTKLISPSAHIQRSKAVCQKDLFWAFITALLTADAAGMCWGYPNALFKY